MNSARIVGIGRVDTIWIDQAETEDATGGPGAEREGPGAAGMGLADKTIKAHHRGQHTCGGDG